MSREFDRRRHINARGSRALRSRGFSLALGAALLLLGLPVAAPAATSPSAAQAPGAPSPQGIMLPARVVAYQAALITAKVAGYVKSIPVDKGDNVKAGGLIAQLEVPELEANRLQYVADLDVARRNYERMQRAIKAAPDLVTPAGLDVQRGKLEVAQAHLARIDALLRYARVTAPFSGTITARYVDPGAFVPVPTGGNQQSNAIVMLMNLERIRVQIPVPQTDAELIRPGCKAVITSSALPGERISASVTRVSYALTQATQTMLAEIDMANPHERLLPGMYVSVRLLPPAAHAASAADVSANVKP